ncbi:hypothetical protein [Clostridium thailandense]|uniref:hypothetical protein n=1 Tax=Clostridium thailandense TaxID=2794346 RepID=UPI00398986C4
MYFYLYCQKVLIVLKLGDILRSVSQLSDAVTYVVEIFDLKANIRVDIKKLKKF